MNICSHLDTPISHPQSSKKPKGPYWAWPKHRRFHVYGWAGGLVSKCHPPSRTYLRFLGRPRNKKRSTDLFEDEFPAEHVSFRATA